MESLRAEVVKYMRSCLNSSKDAICSSIHVGQLNDDYKCLIGESIPYQKLGFKKLIDLIQSEPNEFSLTKKGNEWFVRAIESNRTMHITKMVVKQKKSRRKRAKDPSIYTSPPRVEHMSKWRAPRSHIANRYRGSKRSQTLDHTQFVQRDPTVIYKAPPITSKVVVPEHSNYQTQPLQTLSVPPKHSRYNTKSQRVRAPTALKKESMTQRLNKIKTSENTKKVDNNSSLDVNASAGSKGISYMSRAGGNKIPEFVRTKDPLKDLKYFAEIYKLGEVTVTIAKFKHKKKKMFSCKIKVGSKYTYSSYPNDFFNPLKAQNFSCEEAIKALITKCQRKSLMVASEKDILERIPPMLEKHLYGIWASQLELIYSEKYNEVLSDDWLKTVDISPYVQIEKFPNDYILYHSRYIEKGQRRSTGVLASKVSVPANTIQLEKEGKLIAQVIYVVSAAEIWCQQVGTKESEAFVEIMDRLQVYYEEHESELVPANISTGGYYIAKSAKNYFRVRVLKVRGDEIECFLIDCGFECSFPKNYIFKLEREYANVQAQAIVCRLYGLEELYEVSVDSQSVLNLMENVVLVEVALEAGNSDIYDSLPVYMYDCKTGRSINEDLIPRLTVEMAYPNLSQESITQVYVSNIEPNGDVYVQIRSQGYQNFLKLKRLIEEQIHIIPPKETLHKVTKLNSMEKLYFFKESKDHWSRIKLIDWSPDERYAQIYFVDEGYDRVIKVADEKLYPLEALNDIFNKYPPQAVKVRMDLEQIPTDFVDLASKVMPKNNPMMLRIVKTVKDIPVVKLFRRIGDGALFCINSSLSLNSELKKIESNNLQNRLKHLQLSDSVPSVGVLKCPPLPKIGDHFPVYIPFAVNPFNFFVLRTESRKQLKEMMDRLQERYKDVHDGHLRVEDIQIGSTYASKHEDGIWYRTTVIKVIHSGSVSVCYCDVGYYQTLNLKQLIPLDEEFLKLPYMALKSKLTGVKPTQSKWAMDDCKRFTKLVVNKSFYAILDNIGKDELYESELVLKVRLIDTTLDNVYINEELVKRGIAAREKT